MAEIDSTDKEIVGSFERGLLLITVLLILLAVAFLTDGDWKSWTQPTPMLSLTGLIIGFLIVSWQLDKQHRNTLEANRRQAQYNLRLGIYKEIATRIEATRAPLAELATAPVIFIVELKYFGSIASSSTFVPQSSYSFQSFSAMEQRSSDALFNLVAVLDLYEIVMPEFSIFRETLFAQWNELRQQIGPFALDSSAFMKSDGFGPRTWPPQNTDYAKLDSFARSIQSMTINLSATIEDLRVEAQNYLLGPIFPNRRATPRKPGDPSVQGLRVPSGDNRTE